MWHGLIGRGILQYFPQIIAQLRSVTWGSGERSLDSPDPVWDGPQTEQRRNQRAPRFCSTLEAEDKAVKDCLGVSKKRAKNSYESQSLG
jgi:hypothetical protein